MLHKNSPKRYYIDNAIYFITTVTYDRYPWFKEDLLCRLFIDDLELCAAIKNFTIIGYKINPEHVHLMIQPKEKHDFSEIMRSLKTNFSRNANMVMASGMFKTGKKMQNNSSGSRYRLQKYMQMFEEKHPGINPYPPFKWQLSFHDHIIRDSDDLNNHIRYLEYQWIKHELKENRWLWIAQVGRVT